MRNKKEILAKQKQLRRKVKKRIFARGEEVIEKNCLYFVPQLPNDLVCVFNVQLDLDDKKPRVCPGASTCKDYQNKFNSSQLYEKYLSMVNDPIQLTHSYPGLAVINWVLEDSVPGFFDRLWVKITKIYYKLRSF